MMFTITETFTLSLLPETQTHFSLMGECLDPELPEEEEIDELLRHAVDLQAHQLFRQARASVKRAHLLNDLCTGIQSAFSRLWTAWHFEERGEECPCSEHAEYLSALGAVRDVVGIDDGV